MVRMGPLIGTGGYGRVYRATFSGKQVAIKVGGIIQVFDPLRCLSHLHRQASRFSRLLPCSRPLQGLFLQTASHHKGEQMPFFATLPIRRASPPAANNLLLSCPALLTPLLGS